MPFIQPSFIIFYFTLFVVFFLSFPPDYYTSFNFSALYFSCSHIYLNNLFVLHHQLNIRMWKKMNRKQEIKIHVLDVGSIVRGGGRRRNNLLFFFYFYSVYFVEPHLILTPYIYRTLFFLFLLLFFINYLLSFLSSVSFDSHPWFFRRDMFVCQYYRLYSMFSRFFTSFRYTM